MTRTDVHRGLSITVRAYNVRIASRTRFHLLVMPRGYYQIGFVGRRC